MRCARPLLLALLLGAGLFSPASTWGQDPRGPPAEQRSRGFRLDQNYPNPVNRETWIPFILEESLFEDGNPGIVTIRIVNVLRQLVAIPVAEDHPEGARVPVLELPFRTPGRKTAYWDGKDTAGRRVPSGVYYCQLVVNGQSLFRKMIVVTPRRRPSIIPWWTGTRDRSR
ncbi:hypothetical protein BH24GEM3_BH24GEM3_00480 [soil metagenome]